MGSTRLGADLLAEAASAARLRSPLVEQEVGDHRSIESASHHYVLTDSQLRG